MQHHSFFRNLPPLFFSTIACFFFKTEDNFYNPASYFQK